MMRSRYTEHNVAKDYVRIVVSMWISSLIKASNWGKTLCSDNEVLVDIMYFTYKIE